MAEIRFVRTVKKTSLMFGLVFMFGHVLKMYRTNIEHVFGFFAVRPLIGWRLLGYNYAL
jgi:hypothetical protein